MSFDKYIYLSNPNAHQGTYRMTAILSYSFFHTPSYSIPPLNLQRKPLLVSFPSQPGFVCSRLNINRLIQQVLSGFFHSPVCPLFTLLYISIIHSFLLLSSIYGIFFYRWERGLLFIINSIFTALGSENMMIIIMTTLNISWASTTCKALPWTVILATLSGTPLSPPFTYMRTLNFICQVTYPGLHG